MIRQTDFRSIRMVTELGGGSSWESWGAISSFIVLSSFAWEAS